MMIKTTIRDRRYLITSPDSMMMNNTAAALPHHSTIYLCYEYTCMLLDKQ